MESTIVQYLRKRGPLFRREDGTYVHRYDKVGVVVAVSDGKNYAVGVSKAATARHDVFDPSLGYDIAFSRAVAGLNEGKPSNVPASQLETVLAFNERASEYFKGQSLANDLVSTLNDKGLTVTLEAGYKAKPKEPVEA